MHPSQIICMLYNVLYWVAQTWPFFPLGFFTLKTNLQIIVHHSVAVHGSHGIREGKQVLSYPRRESPISRPEGGGFRPLTLNLSTPSWLIRAQMSPALAMRSRETCVSEKKKMDAVAVLYYLWGCAKFQVSREKNSNWEFKLFLSTQNNRLARVVLNIQEMKGTRLELETKIKARFYSCG